MANAVQDSIFQNAGIKRKGTSYLDLYENKEDFNIENALSADEVNTAFNNKFFGTDEGIAPSVADTPLFDFDIGDIDLGGAAAIAKGIGSIWDAYNKKQYQEEIVDMEKERVAREVDKQKKAQSAFDSAWA